MKHASRWSAALAATVLLTFVVGVAPASAATDWSPLNSSTTSDLNGLSMASEQLGVAVGDGGTIVRTTDGATWGAVSSGTTVNLNDVDQVSCTADDSNSGGANVCFVAVGNSGTILASTDSGATWCPQTSGVTSDLNAVEMGMTLTSTQTNFEIVAVGDGGTVLRRVGDASCAGAYTKQTTNTVQSLQDVRFALVGNTTQKSMYWAVGTAGAAIRGEATGPAAITFSNLSTGTTATLNAIDIFNLPAGSDENAIGVMAVGAGGVARKSSDNGDTWSAVTTGTPATLYDLLIFGNGTLHVVGDGGTILRSTDTGATFTKVASGVCTALFAITNAGSAPIWASGASGTLITNTPDPNRAEPTCAGPQTGESGYRMVASDGGVFTFGNRTFYGSTGDMTLAKPIVGGATDGFDYEGYWIVASDGGVFSFGVPFFGSLGGQSIPAPAVEIEPTPTGKGYWIVLANGKVYPFGDAAHFGDMSTKQLNQTVIGMTVTPTGQGYWLVAQDGGVFSFGDARFHGSMGDQRLNAPVIDLAPAADNQGYYLVAKDGGVFTFGSADFKGSTGDMKLNQPVIAILVAPSGAGYWLAASDGGVFTFGAIPFLGSMGGTKLNGPVLDVIN